jgi:hypothetical protein
MIFRMRHPFLFGSGFAAVATFALTFGGCGDSAAPPYEDPGGGKKDGSAVDGNPSTPDSGGGTDTGATTTDCTNTTVKASDDPVCDQCAKAKCCKEVMACDQSADCKAFGKCLDACADGDIVCVLTCASLHGKGSDIAQELGACASSECKTECKPPDAGGGGFDF